MSLPRCASCGTTLIGILVHSGSGVEVSGRVYCDLACACRDDEQAKP